MFKRIIYLVLCFFLYCSNVLAEGLSGFEHAKPEAIPAIDFINFDNDIVKLDSYSGKTVLLNFWATWCTPCVHEMPALAALNNRLDKDKAVVIPVSIDISGVDSIKEFYTKNNIKGLPIFVDKTSKAFTRLKVQALPTTVIINKEGLEAARILGAIDWDSQSIAQYLEDL